MPRFREPMKYLRYALQWVIDDAVDRTRQGGVWVEVGVGVGRGIAYMARALLDAKRDDVTLYAIDPWAGTARCGQQQDSGPASPHGDWSLFLDHMRRHAPEELERIHVLRLPSLPAADAIRALYPTTVDRACPVDLAIIDAAHDFESVWSDIGAWGPLICAGGAIGGDDVLAGSDVEKAVLAWFPRCERRGDPRAEEGCPHEMWPTFRQVMP